MSSNKKQAANGNKAAMKANESALKGFPKAKLKAAFDSMATLAKAGDEANDSRQAAALGVLDLASTFADKNSGIDLGTIITGWRDSLKVLTMELAVAGNRFAELTEGKGDNAATAKLTGYGNNVASIAKGVIEFEIAIAADESYRDIRKEVEAKRADARRTENPEAAALADAKSACDDTWSELRKVMFDTGDVGNINVLAVSLQEILSDVQAQLIAQSDLDAEANGEDTMTDDEVAEAIANADAHAAAMADPEAVAA